jgi:hypothetical protein
MDSVSCWVGHASTSSDSKHEYLRGVDTNFRRCGLYHYGADAGREHAEARGSRRRDDDDVGGWKPDTGGDEVCTRVPGGNTHYNQGRMVSPQQMDADDGCGAV